jgi:hypothetical protein
MTVPTSLLLADILEDDYGLKKTFKVKHSTPHGVGFTVENEHKKGAISGKISAKYAYKPWGLNFDKVWTCWWPFSAPPH